MRWEIIWCGASHREMMVCSQLPVVIVTIFYVEDLASISFVK